ncbi:tyrosine-type recombinase/integrase [Cytobacillus sp. S13-E01]|uniref:tyrosine-type recombinase/integrase n=1 Tax=Cytobacillus sp. S13-E01 TaxID=3031326 RepID=UPI0023D8619F|nr:tyrosine-type recombinase/integrase [Cytobacillus sp. S13-E01]MDF0727317.1 tyrosine-type recombinase/integrase [Cytobacillus sp. S13-E01]
MIQNTELSSLLTPFGEWLLENGKSVSTVKTYNGALEKFLGWLMECDKDIFKITREDVQGYMQYLESLDRSPATIEKAFSTLSVYAKFLDKPEITKNINRVENEKDDSAPVTLESSERSALLKEVELDGDIRNTAIVYTLLHTGIRISELCALNHSDIQVDSETGKGKLFIRTLKGEVKRVIPMSRELMYQLQRYKNSIETSQEALFISSVNKRISTRGVQYMLKKYDVNPHKLRHTFCSDLVQNGIDLATVAELAGHADVNVTKRYVKPTSSDIEDAIDKTFI